MSSSPPLQVPWPAPPVAFSTELKRHPSDFVVEEVAAYEPSGEGEFLYLWIEKVDVSSEWLLKAVSERLGVRRDAIGTAGRKDRRAMTRQWVSVHARDIDASVGLEASDNLSGCGEAGVDALAKLKNRLDGPVGKAGQLRLLRADRHGNKLKTGHLKANRFEVILRGAALAQQEQRTAIQEGLARAASRGTPNLYGGQRFLRGDTVQMGLDALAGRRMKNKRLLKLGISAVQSAVFNHWLAARVAAGNLETALLGDVLQKRETGGTFHCEDPALDTERIEAGELVVTGPMPGNKYRAAKADAAAFEAAALAAMGLEPDSFRPIKKLAMGTRRAAWVLPTETSFRVDESAADEGEPSPCVVGFTLPKGAYATVLLEAIAGASQTPYTPQRPSTGEPPTGAQTGAPTSVKASEGAS